MSKKRNTIEKVIKRRMNIGPGMQSRLPKEQEKNGSEANGDRCVHPSSFFFSFFLF